MIRISYVFPSDFHIKNYKKFKHQSFLIQNSIFAVIQIDM